MSARNSADGEISEAVRHAAERLSSDLSRTARDAREAADDLSGALKRSAKDALHTARERATDAANEAHQSAQQGMRTHPIAWLGAAAGVGALMGVVLASRTRSR